VASVCQDLVEKYGEDYELSHTETQDENTVVCYGKTEGGGGSPDLVGSACKTAAEELAKEPATLEKGVVEDYKTSKKTTGDGSVDRDHQPSKAALKNRAEQIKGDRLTPAEAKRIEDNAHTVTVSKDVHKAGPTHGSKNTPERIKTDACDLSAATCRDADAMVENTKKLDPGNLDKAKKAAEKIKTKTNKDYDDFLKKQLED
jgi:filamentous hemagglutinin